MDEIALRTKLDLNNQFEQGLSNCNKYINREYLLDLTSCEIIALDDDLKKTNNIRLFLVNKIVFDDKENTNDKLISVYSAILNVGANAILLLRGKKEGVDFYLGINDSNNISVAEKTLRKSFSANFPGSELIRKNNTEILDILSSCIYENTNSNITSVTMVPSSRDQDKEKFVQGIEKFIDTMRGENYSAVFISNPVSDKELSDRKRGLEELYTALSPFIKTSLAYGENDSLAVSEGVFDNFSSTINDSVALTLGKNSSRNKSKTKGNSIGMNLGFSLGSNKSETEGTSIGTSSSKSETTGTAETTGSGTNKTDTKTTGTSQTITLEKTNKTVEVALKNVEEQLERIKNCEAFGVWETAAYFIAEEVQTSIVAANTYKALVSGDESGVEKAYINIWNQHNSNTKELAEYIKYCYHPLFSVKNDYGELEQIVTPANYVSGKELPLFMGLPRKSVSGVSVTTMAEFSRNVFVKNSLNENYDRKIILGCIHHMGVDETENLVKLDLDNFTSHCFICGSTGSGKSNTVYHLLNNFIAKNIPFLVVEPAKGEYKKDFGNLEGINVFCTNPYYGAMLKINPFEFDPKIHVLEHLDRLIEIFNACWEMYAAMPAILKNAVEKAYIEKGWDLLNSVYINGGRPEYPTFEDVLKILPKIINTSGYSADTQGDYTGALVTRVESLTNGITGQIFCDNYFVKDKTLFDENTIVDLSRVGSNETKSLIMGILVMKLNEYRMANTLGTNKQLEHVTILEEAHNLLKNVSQSQGQQSANPIGKSVEMICNSIAEMRTYGEGFVIVDQSPSSVDIAAIKNTNTKIIMRLPEKADCEAVGNAIGLKDEQIRELSKLPVGVAATMQNNWLDAVLCKISRASNKYEVDSIKQMDYSTMKSIKSVIIEELLNQLISHQNTVDVDRLNKIITQFDIAYPMKNELIGRMSLLKNLTGRELQKVACYSIFNITGVSNIFEMNESQIANSYKDLSIVNSWKQSIIKSLKTAIDFKEESNYENLFLRLLIIMMGKNVAGYSVYVKIYHLLYDRR